MKKTSILLGILGLTGCVSVPDIYVIDRHTVMEAEASGEWPELEKRLLQDSIAKGPTNLPVEPFEDRKKKAFKVLNDEMPTRLADEPTDSHE